MFGKFTTPRARLGLYLVGVLVFASLGLLSFFKVITPEMATHISAYVTGILGLFGVTVSGTAAINVSKQINNGNFDPKPAPAQTTVLSPADAVINILNGAVDQKAAAEKTLQDIQGAIHDAIGKTPVLGPSAQEAFDKITKGV